MPESYYHYEPSVAAASIFAILFLLTTLLHTWQLVRTKTWYFLAFVLGSIVETAGYAARIVSARQTPDYTLTPYLLQTIFVLVAPALMTASIYMILGRIIEVTEGEKYSLIRRTWLTKIFVCLDVLSFLVQFGGAGILTQAKTADKLQLGKTVILVGLFVQIIGFAAFTLTSVWFHMGLIKRHETGSTKSSNIPWRKHLNVLYVACGLIFFRSVFRVIEFAQGPDGVIFRNEWFLYVFDSVLIIITVVMFHFVHPSEIKAILAGGKQTRQKNIWQVKEVSRNPQGGSTYPYAGQGQESGSGFALAQYPV